MICRKFSRRTICIGNRVEIMFTGIRCSACSPLQRTESCTDGENRQAVLKSKWSWLINNSFMSLPKSLKESDNMEKIRQLTNAHTFSFFRKTFFLLSCFFSSNFYFHFSFHLFLKKFFFFLLLFCHFSPFFSCSFFFVLFVNHWCFLSVFISVWIFICSFV